MADPEFYRDKDELEQWRHLDPITTYRARLEKERGIDSKAFDDLQNEIEETVNKATRFAEESPDPPPEALYQHVYRGGGP
jgi:pyruvate dehydrogenase E1 component alpha subunit